MYKNVSKLIWDSDKCVLYAGKQKKKKEEGRGDRRPSWKKLRHYQPKHVKILFY